MSQNTLDITLAQLNPTVGDLDGNFELIRNTIQENADTDILVFAESITTGYPADDLILNDHFMDCLHKKIDRFLEEKYKPLILLPTAWCEKNKKHNVVLAIQDGEIKHITYKHKLPNYDVFDEVRIYSRKDLPTPYDYNGVKLGIMICEDMWYDDIAQHLSNQGTDILIVPNGSVYQANIDKDRINNASQRIEETELPLIYLNQVGGQDELVFDGGSFILNSDKKVALQASRFKEEIIRAKWNQSNNGWQCESNIIAEPLQQEEEIYQAVTLGLRDYVTKNNFPGVLIGLSGGIDSAISAAIAVDALGANKVHCVMMPSPYTSQDSLDDAEACAQALGVKLDTIPINAAIDAYETMLENHVDKDNAGTTFENIQSRARGMVLMALSNANGKMVLSTGNKSEIAVGYATLYGDMCGGYNAIKDIYKTKVYKLAEWRNAQGLVIPERIITKAPSAELKPDQTDQDNLPPYDVLDNILIGLIEDNQSPNQISDKHGYDVALVNRVWKMLDSAEYKRKQAPPGPKVTSLAFGRNRRYPITNGFGPEG